jgi:hypothetical protein
MKDGFLSGKELSTRYDKNQEKRRREKWKIWMAQTSETPGSMANISRWPSKAGSQSRLKAGGIRLTSKTRVVTS